MNNRTEGLRQKLMMQDDRQVFLERVFLLEEACREYEGLTPGKKYALGFSHIVSNMSVVLGNDELIVGNVKEVIPNEEENTFLCAAEKNDFSALALFSFDPLNLIAIEDLRPRYAPSWFNSWGHLTVSWPTLLQKGYKGIRQDAENRLNRFVGTNDRRARVHEEYLENAITACDAMIELGKRYAAAATEMARRENKEKRRQELTKISDICSRIPGEPPATLWEALQSIWLTNMVLHCVCGARDWGLGRLDQYLYPFYKKAKERGEEANTLELLECFFIKLNQIIGRGVENYTPKRSLCVNSLQYVIIGGKNERGEDAANELSHLIIEAVGNLQLKQPTVVVRYHKSLDRRLFQKACAVVKRGTGNPGFFNDEVVIHALENLGVSQKDALDYVHYGCVNPNIPGKEDGLREAWHNLPKYLELALNEGRCMLTEKSIGLHVEPVSEMDSFEDLLEALRLQIRNAVALAVERIRKSDEAWQELKPFSFESLLLGDCVERAENCTSSGVAYKHMNHHGVGIATLANSLASIRRLVFEEKRLSLQDLREILKVNFKSHAGLREEILNKQPKYGNDISAVDEIAQKAGYLFCEEVRRASPIEDSGRVLWPSFYSLWHHREMGKSTAARADGSLAQEPLSESQSPVYGTDVNGPTALLNSVSRLPFEFTPGGGINVKLQPSLLKGDKGAMVLSSLVEGYFSQGGLEIQINVVDKDILVDAQKNPEKHKNLLVRVVGYSAYFVTLLPDQQDEIIKRTEHCAGQ